MEKKIWLDKLRAEDRDTVFSMTSDPEIVKYMRFDTHEKPEEAEELIRHYTEGGNYGFLIRIADSGEPVGVAALKQDEENCGEYSVSLFSFQRFWNKGYNTAAVELLKTFAQEQGIRALKAYVVEENYGSRKVMEKCGFQIQEILHFDDFPSGLYVYALPMESSVVPDIERIIP